MKYTGLNIKGPSGEGGSGRGVDLVTQECPFYLNELKGLKGSQILKICEAGWRIDGLHYTPFEYPLKVRVRV